MNGVVVVSWAAPVVVGDSAVLVGPAVLAAVGVVEEVCAVVVGVGAAVVGTTVVTLVGTPVVDSDCAPAGRADTRAVVEVTAKVTKSAAVTRRFANRWFIGDIERLVSGEDRSVRGPSDLAASILADRQRFLGHSGPPRDRFLAFIFGAVDAASCSQ